MNSERPPSSTVRDMPRRSASTAASTSSASSAASPSVPSSRPSSWTTSAALRWRARRQARAAPNSAGGASAGSGVTTAAPCPPAPSDATAAATVSAGTAGSHQHVDRAAAGEPDVPRLLVADAVADDAGVAVAAGALDLLGRRALHAAAADRPCDPAVAGVEQDRALRPRRGPERPDDDGAPDLGPLRLARRPASRAAPSSDRPRRGGIGRARRRRRRDRARHGRGDGDGRSRPRWSSRGVPRGRPPRCPAGCRPSGRRPGSRRAARATRRCRPAGSRRCTGMRRASRRPAAGSRACPRAD